MSQSQSAQQLNVDGTEACMCLCGLKFKQQKDEKYPDHLKNWEVWMERRKRIHKTLSKRLECSPGDLLMNCGDTCRQVKEEKLALEYTKIENHFDKYRGNPEFWKLPWSLKSQVPPYDGTEYFVTKPKEDKNEIPDIEYVGVPDYILEEKSLVPRTRNLKSLWTESTYRQEVVERVSEKLREIEPHKPDLSNLIVIGSNFQSGIVKSTIALSAKRSISRSLTTTDSKREIRVIEDIASDTSSSEKSEKSLSTLFKKISLKVNNREFNEYSYFSKMENKVSLIFEYYIDSRVPSEQILKFENCGQVVLRINWRQYKKMNIFREYTHKTDIFHPFRFNKNELLLMPGTKKHFPIWFQVDKPGNYFEYWEIVSLPKIWKLEFHLIIMLKGFAFIKDYELRAQQITERLQQRIRNTTIKNLLNDIISRGSYCAPTITQSYSFSEEELFESVNLRKHIAVNTPKYVYNPNVIAELRHFYKQVRFPEDPEQWNLSLKKLCEMARKKDIFAYFENRLALYRTARTRRQTLKEINLDVQKKQTANRDKGSSKKSTEKSQKDISHESEEKETITYFSRFNNIVRKLEKPSIYMNKDRKKYLFSYIILRTLFWKMLDQLDQFEDTVSEVSDLNKSSENSISDIKQYCPLLPVPDRLLYEIFDERYILRTKRISHVSEASKAKPKAIQLKGIPNADTKKIFKTYFSKDEAVQKGVQAKRLATENKKPVVGKGQKNKLQANQDEDMYLNVIEDFEPFYEDFHWNCEPSEIKTHSDTSEVVPQKINEHKYVIVYTTLCNAVDAIVDTIETFDERSISSDTLGELQKCFEAPVQIENEKLTEQPSKVTVRSGISNKVFQKEMDVSRHSDYYNLLEDLYWTNNLNTQKYFVGEERKSITALESLAVEDEVEVEAKVKESLLNVFSLEDFKPKVEPYCLKERAAQTDSVMENEYENVFAVLEPTSQNDRTESGDSLESPRESRNIFYFLTDKDSGDTRSNR